MWIINQCKYCDVNSQLQINPWARLAIFELSSIETVYMIVNEKVSWFSMKSFPKDFTAEVIHEEDGQGNNGRTDHLEKE